ncbi:MAG: hypothetical protein K8R59_14890, partial [Thermoanaerobaculales bacterium]|nr:hypothetical protein [Thermoanaerobaculales bacterium]
RCEPEGLIMRRLIFALTLVALVGGVGFAQANAMVLTSQGHLYKVWVADEGLVLTHSGSDIDSQEAVVPQTVGMDLDRVVLVVDEATATPFIIWTDSLDGLSSVRLAALVDGTWFGPAVLGGEDGTVLTNPHALIHKVRTVIEGDDGSESEILETTFLHTVWWRHDNVTALGHAVYLPIPLDSNGIPLLNEAEAHDLENLLPFGVACDNNPDVAGLASARFFVGAGGLPQLFTPDFGDCVFHLLGIDYEVEEQLDPYTGLKRRRQVVIFRSGDVMMAIPQDVNLEASKMFLGRADSVLIYWDGNEAVEWILSGDAGWTDVKSLTLDADINHEQAVELLRELAR